MKRQKEHNSFMGFLLLHRRNIIIIACVVLILYIKSLFGAFLWDDEEQIVNNTLVHTLSNIPNFFSGSTFNTGGANTLTGVYYRPIMMLFFSLVYSFFGASAWIFHFLQILLHIIVVVIGYLFYVNTFTKGKDLSKEKKSKIEALGLLFSLIFSVHPLNVETVAYISAAQDVFYTLFGIMAIFVASNANISKKKNLVITFIFLTLALFSKESALIFVILLIVHGLIFDFSKKYYYIAVSILSAAIYFFVRVVLINVSFGEYDISPISELNVMQRLFTIPKVIWYYISNLFYPDNLSVMQHWVVKNPTLLDFWAPLVGIVLILSVFGFAFYKTKSKELLFFTIWATLSLGMHSQIYPLDMTVATRWIYSGLLGMIGMLIVLIFLLLQKYENSQVFKSIVVLLVFVSLAFAARTFIRLEAWQNGYLLYSKDILRNPNSFDLNNNYGVELFRNGSPEEALIYFEKSIKRHKGHRHVLAEE